MLQAYEPRIAVYGAALHQQEPDVSVAVGKDGYLKVSTTSSYFQSRKSTPVSGRCLTWTLGGS